MSINKYSFRKRLLSAPALKKCNSDKSPSVLTRSALRYVLFNPTSTGTASHVRKLVRKVAQPMINYGDFLCKTNKNYDSLWIVFEDSISNLVISPLFRNNSENTNEISTFLAVLEELKASIIPAIIGLNSMVSAVISLKGMESSITRASSLIELESKAFVGLLNKSVSTLDRIVLIGKTQIPVLIEV
ncbi:hypothetical protein E4V42_23195 [Clostridium estertheticum]|uniref:Uncharacterized protein n=1 Tax=Clostridium estertheticum TaxID=238834 RepID=A0A5N7J888_9CLOT|nr:hypothetical protein [Clostridium estertheticum]MPQ34294.1 hypothetical protein [Clostridium estertheticum]MPQ64956.1 hypothetical protein [Clostridium estertheticum]